MSINCNESFLEDVTRIQVYKASDFTAPMPPTLPNIISMNINPASPVLDISYDSEGISAKEKSFAVKQSTRQSGSTLLYIYNVDSTIDNGVTDLAALSKQLVQEDHHIIVTTQDNKQRLLYGLPGTFAIDFSNALVDGSLKLSLSSLNNYINISPR